MPNSRVCVWVLCQRIALGCLNSAMQPHTFSWPICSTIHHSSSALKLGHVTAVGLDIYECESSYFSAVSSTTVISDDSFARPLPSTLCFSSFTAFVLNFAITFLSTPTITIWYIPVLAVNSGLEAFLSSVATPKDLNNQSQ